MKLVILLVLFTVMMFFGCRTTIPATDTEKPGVDAIFSGPGFRNYHCGTTECSDTPDLLSGTGAYGAETVRILETSLGDGIITVAVTVGDRGGVKVAGILLFGEENRDYQLIERPTSAQVSDTDSAHKNIFVPGDAADPGTVLGLTVKIRLLGASRGVSVTAYGLDFGGSSGRSNSNETRATNFQVWHRSP